MVDNGQNAHDEFSEAFATAVSRHRAWERETDLVPA